MATVLFDTLALARKLEAAGFPPKQAQDTAAALAESLGQDMLTRRDLGETTSALRAELREIETNLRAELSGLAARLGAEMSELAVSLRTEVSELEGRLRAEIRESEHRTTLRLGTMMAASIALVAALVKLL
jgi:gamma-glutamyl:cysteine ligase YbdK (ATP-grasp superfamily)